VLQPSDASTTVEGHALLAALFDAALVQDSFGLKTDFGKPVDGYAITVEQSNAVVVLVLVEVEVVEVVDTSHVAAVGVIARPPLKLKLVAYSAATMV
jgi:hypothetical protein